MKGAAALVCALVTGTARAQTVPLAVAYQAPPGCPAKAQFDHEVSTRVHDRDRADQRSFQIRITKNRDGFEGRLVIVGEEGARSVRSPSCEAVARSLAIFVALTLDPVVEAPVPAQVAPPRIAPPARHLPGVTPRPLRRPAPSTPPRWAFTSSLGLEHRAAAASFLGIRTHAELARHLRSGGVFPLVRGSWGSATQSVRARDGQVSFVLATARADACAAWQHLALRIALCAAWEVGRLRAEASGLARNGSARAHWDAPGAMFLARVQVTSWLGLDAQMGLLAPRVRSSFRAYEPDRGVYAVPPLTVSSQLGFAATGVF